MLRSPELVTVLRLRLVLFLITVSVFFRFYDEFTAYKKIEENEDYVVKGAKKAKGSTPKKALFLI